MAGLDPLNIHMTEIIYTLMMTHITIICVTLYLHRGQAHKAVNNGLAHWIGYRNYDTKDTARNLFPWGIVIGGEELHNNHHGDGANAKLSKRWFEFDIGWFYIQVLSKLGLAKVRATAK